MDEVGLDSVYNGNSSRFSGEEEGSLGASEAEAQEESTLQALYKWKKVNSPGTCCHRPPQSPGSIRIWRGLACDTP